MCQKLGRKARRDLAMEQVKFLETTQALFGELDMDTAYNLLLSKKVPSSTASSATEMFLHVRGYERHDWSKTADRYFIDDYGPVG